MLHHVSIGVSDLARAAAFYDAVLGTRGYVRVWTVDTAVGFDPDGHRIEAVVSAPKAPIADGG